MSTLLKAFLVAAATLSGSPATSAEPVSALSCETQEIAEVSYTIC